MAKIRFTALDFTREEATVVYESGATKKYFFDKMPETVRRFLKETQDKDTLEEIEVRTNPFGLVACKRSVTFEIEELHEDPFEMLKEYEQRAKEDVFFNIGMIEAVKLYIEEKGLTEEEEKKEMTNEERAEAKTKIRVFKEDVISAYESTETPRECVAWLSDQIGYKEAEKAIATVVNMVSLSDGRIYDKVREWSQSVDGAFDNAICRELGFYGVDSWIHSAHVNQLGEAMRDYEPKEEEPTPEEPSEQTETVDVCDIIKEIRDNVANEIGGELLDIDCVCDWDSGYVCDIFSEWADNNITIHTADTYDFISDHVYEVEEAISEFGWEGVGKTLKGAGQTAEWIMYNNWVWAHEKEAMKIWALNYYRMTYGERISPDTWERMEEEMDDYGQFDRIDQVGDLVDEVAEIMRGEDVA